MAILTVGSDVCLCKYSMCVERVRETDKAMYCTWLFASWVVIQYASQSETHHSCRYQADCHLSPLTSFWTPEEISGTTLPFPDPSSQTGRLSDPPLQRLVFWVPLLIPILRLSRICPFVLASRPALLICPPHLRASLPGPWTWSPPAWPAQCKWGTSCSRLSSWPSFGAPAGSMEAYRLCLIKRMKVMMLGSFVVVFGAVECPHWNEDKQKKLCESNSRAHWN